MRSAFVVVVLGFSLILGGLTLSVIAQSGLDIFTVVSLFIVAMFAIAGIGALRNPPGR